MLSDFFLVGIIVFDFICVFVGFYVIVLLGDFGVMIVKVESKKGGDIICVWLLFEGEYSFYFDLVNCNKLLIVIDFYVFEGVVLLCWLCLGVDVVIENFKFGILVEMGFVFELLCVEKLLLIIVLISGFG